MSKYQYAVVKTQFHRGGIISRHRSYEAAQRAQRKYANIGNCVCGCAVIVPIDELDNLPRAGDFGVSAYSAAL